VIVGVALGSGVGVGTSGGRVAVAVGGTGLGVRVAIWAALSLVAPGMKIASSGGLIVYWMRAFQSATRGSNREYTGGSL
jgi:hypothetical protein